VSPRAVRWSLLGALLAGWFAAAAAGLNNPVILPAPQAVAVALWRDLPAFGHALAFTCGEIAAALAIGWAAGCAAGGIAGSHPASARVVSGLLTSAFAVPIIILYPLLLAWTGIGWPSKILFGVLSGFFPIALNTLAAVRAVDPKLVTMARAMGASRAQILVRVVARAALPGIVAGLRVGTALTVIGVVVTEMLGATAGLGYLISYHTTLFDTGHVYAGIALALVVVFGLNLGLGSLERRLRGELAGAT